MDEILKKYPEQINFSAMIAKYCEFDMTSSGFADIKENQLVST